MSKDTLNYADKTVEVKAILDRAKKDSKGNMMVYNFYKRELEDLNLTPGDYERAVRKLSGVLKI